MNGRTSGEDRALLVESIGVPLDTPAARRFVERDAPPSAALLGSLIDDEVATQLWRSWHPARAAQIEDPAFRAALRDWLSAGAAMGHALHRFRPASGSLLGLAPTSPAWVETFERAAAAASVVPPAIVVAPDVRSRWLAMDDEDGGAPRWADAEEALQNEICYELGIVLPPIELRGDERLTPTELRFEVHDARLPVEMLLAADRLLVAETADRLRLLDIEAEPAEHPAHGDRAAIVRRDDREQCVRHGLVVSHDLEFALFAMRRTIRRFAGAFVHRNLVDFHLDKLATAYPVLVEETERVVSRDEIAQVLRGLVDEHVSIRHLSNILEVLMLRGIDVPVDMLRRITLPAPALARCLQHERAPLLDRRLTRVRAALRAHVSTRHLRGGGALLVFLLDLELERFLAAVGRLDNDDRQLLVEAVAKEVGPSRSDARGPVLLTTSQARPTLRRALAPAMPDAAVLGYGDLMPTVNIQPIARIAAPRLTDARIRLARSDRGAWAVAIDEDADDPLVRTLAAQATAIASTASADAAEHRELVGCLAQECLHAVLGEMLGQDAARRFAHALVARATVPIVWAQIPRLCVDVGRAAIACVLDEPGGDFEERPSHRADVERIRGAAHRLAVETVLVALVIEHMRGTARRPAVELDLPEVGSRRGEDGT